MTRAKTQGPGGKPPRATTQGGGRSKRASTHGGLFNDLEAAIDAIDALDESSARHAATKKPALPPPPAKRSVPGPSPTTPRTTPPKPPPGAERAAAIRARSARAQSQVGLDPVPRVTRPPPPGVPEPTGLSIDIDLEESQPAARAYDSAPIVRGQRAISPEARAISVGETAAEDLVIEGAELPPINALAIAILDDPPYIATAKQAIAVAGHKVVAAASGQAGVEQIKSLLRSGNTQVLLVGMPGGEALIDTALALAPRRPVVIAVLAGKPVDVARKAAGLGADLAIARPVDLDKLVPVLLAASRLDAERQVATNARGSETVLRARLDALVDHEPGALQPFELFQRVLELELKRSKRYGYPIAVALFSVGVGGDEPPPPGVQGIVRARAGNALIHSIRDIDLATELDQERFLVLLPYTTLSGAAEVARRILHAVTSTHPISAAGKTFPPKIVGAVAGAQPGQPLSFSRLMRDATQALEQARRDGAELAVPMIRGPA